MGCAASTQPASFHSCNRRTRSSSSGSRSGSSRSLFSSLSDASFYNLERLKGRDVVGPFLKLHSYDPATGSYQLTVLLVCTAAAQHRHHDHAQISWWELQPMAEPAPRKSCGGGDGAPRRKSFGGGGGPHSGEPGGGGGDGLRHGSAAGEVLYTWRDWRFWRFGLGVTCGKVHKQLRYQIGLLPGRTFTVAVPSLDEPWHVAFYSCNGLHDADEYCRPTGLHALWHDLMRRHETQPFHLLLGGGDQLYNDGVFEGPLLKGWDDMQHDKDAAVKAAIPFSPEMKDEVEEFYFSHYAAHWSHPAYREALACIPSFNTWDDHDIVDGWGSYPDLINNAAIMRGVFAAASLFYHLFQHHTTTDRLPSDGYWCQPASCALLRLGASTALLVPDTRTFRTQNRVLPPDFEGQMTERLRALPPSVRHVVVMVGAPVLYPHLPVQEALQKLDDLATGDSLLSIIMQKTGLAAQVAKRFGVVSLLDDIIDQWSASQHVQERDDLITRLMDLAAEKRFRVSFLSGDVHCAAYGMYHSRGGLRESEVGDMALPEEAARAADPRFVPQIISSAIVNVPPPVPLLKALCIAGRCPEPILKDCVQRMVHLFGPEGDCDSLLMGRRNWCEILLGDQGGNLTFSLRCEKELGSEEVNVFKVTVPPLLDTW